MKKFIEYLTKLGLAKFYGEVTIKFENGQIVHVKESKSYSKEHFGN